MLHQHNIQCHKATVQVTAWMQSICMCNMSACAYTRVDRHVQQKSMLGRTLLTIKGRQYYYCPLGHVSDSEGTLVSYQTAPTYIYVVLAHVYKVYCVHTNNWSHAWCMCRLRYSLRVYCALAMYVPTSKYVLSGAYNTHTQGCAYDDLCGGFFVKKADAKLLKISTMLRW